eukprot:CAMPEP_0204904160 /NCGR_PEP_ID=MMETSP1397-20131031/4701_1 /ASSEMBLY_ACC=CAM_ASM_000891 /TAXON_ID=49980 /ORGANISM="Climacostomum Climacostomum virens, Strain Stock W-24" /LENGTH=300 /DNA_ID=CAMNT_0052072911 /DNA_START=1407 /DNA_END=2309 /DNA_ORIENTATION=-
MSKGYKTNCITSFPTDSTLKTDDSKAKEYTEIISVDDPLPEKSLLVYRMLKQKDERIEELAKELATLKTDFLKKSTKVSELLKELDHYKAIVDYCSKQLGLLDEEALYKSTETMPAANIVNTAKLEEMMLASYQLDMWKAKSETAEAGLKTMGKEVEKLKLELASKDRACRVTDDLMRQVELLKVQFFQKDCELELVHTDNKRLKDALERESAANRSHVDLIKRLNKRLAESRRAVIENEHSIKEEQLEGLIKTLEGTLEREEARSLNQLFRYMRGMSQVADENKQLRQELEALKANVVA